MLWRELSQPAFRSVYVKVVAILACLVGLAWLYIDVGIDTPATNMMIPIIGTLLLVVMVANSSSGSIATEREAKTWGLLLTTPLRPRQIMLGKMGGAMRRQWLIFGVLGLHIGCQVWLVSCRLWSLSGLWRCWFRRVCLCRRSARLRAGDEIVQAGDGDHTARARCFVDLPFRDDRDYRIDRAVVRHR